MKGVAWMLAFALAANPAFSETGTKGTDKKKGLSLGDLGFTAAETRSDPQYQRLLEKRSHMLKAHQVMGMVTLVPMWTNALLSSGVEESQSRRDLHAGLGLTTAALYCTTACLAIFAPKPKGVHSKGATKYHKILAYIHFPAMVAVPILGAMAKHQLDRGEEVHGIASLHGAAVGVLLGSYTAAMAVQVFNF